MADVAKTVSVIFQGEDRTTAVAGSIGKSLDTITDSSTTASRGMADLEARTGGLTDAMDFLGGVAKGALAALSVGRLVQEYIGANVELEKFSRSISAISGSSDAAGRELEYVRGVANRLGLDIRTTADAWVQLSASAKGTTLEGEQSRRVFEAVSSAMSLLGKSSADTQGALLAIQQIISKGTVSSEELRGQLGERLPGAFQIAARAVGVTTQELGKLLEAGELTANEFLPKFAAELENTFGKPQQVDSYTAAVNRFKNSIEVALQDVGQSAGGLGTSIIDIGSKAVTALGAIVAARVEASRALLDVARGGSFDTFDGILDSINLRLKGVGATLSGDLNQSLAETERLTRQAAAATADYGDQTEAETERLKRQASAQVEALNATAAAFKTLGVRPEAVKSVQDIISAFDTLTKASNVTGGQLLAGLEGVLKNIDDKQYLPKLKDQLQEAWAQGRITSDELAKGFSLISKEQEGLDKKLGITTKSIADQAREAEKAAEKAAQWRLEIEKLASNERIKTLEFKANLDIANVQEQTKRIQAAFESLDNTVNSTADVINKAFGLLAGGGEGFIDSSVRNKLFTQLDIENANRERALAKQAELTDAQIKVLRAQAEQLTRGDALIKIDGTGLAPHLEAFMWEVLKAVQVRGNRDGMKLLLNV